MLTRRQMLKVMSIALGSLSTLSRPAYATTAAPAKSARYVLQIVFPGGVDAIFTTDPKERSEIDPDVDLPYEPKDITNVGRARFGPHFAPLAKWAPRITIVNGVTAGVANHPAGARQLLRMRLGATDEMPTALELIGSRRDGQALPSVLIGGAGGTTGLLANNMISDGVFAALDQASPEELSMMARVARKRGKSVTVTAGTATKANIEDCAELFERLATTPRFQATPGASFSLNALQRAMWLFQHDLARCAVVSINSWDSHTFNTPLQTGAAKEAFPAISEFLAQMEKTTNKHGALLANTLIVMSSELGRFPVLNPRAGKDHFPEMPVIFINADSGGNTFGRTGRRMQALPFERKGSTKVTLTDVGTTVLRLAGVNPETCGYNGLPLEFLGV